MNTKINFLFVFLLVFSLVAAGCSLHEEIPQEGEQQPVVIGAVLPLTGIAAGQGEFLRQGIELAASEIEGVEIIVEDDETSPTKAVSAYNKLVQADGVDAVIGGAWDFIAQPLLPLAEENELAFVSPSNFRIEGSFEMGEQSFVMMPEFSKVIYELEDHFKDSNVNKLAVVRFSSDFGKEISETLDGVMQGLGKDPIVDEPYVEIGSGDFRTTITRLKELQVDAVFLDMLDSDAVSFLQQARELDFSPEVVSYTLILDALANPDVDKDLLEGVVVLNWDLANEEFARKFEDKYGILPAKSANQAYDAVYVLAEAIKNSPKRNEVSRYLESHSFETVNGTIKFSQDHAVESTPVRVQKIMNGQLQ